MYEYVQKNGVAFANRASISPYLGKTANFPLGSCGSELQVGLTPWGRACDQVLANETPAFLWPQQLVQNGNMTSSEPLPRGQSFLGRLGQKLALDILCES